MVLLNKKWFTALPIYIYNTIDYHSLNKDT